GRREIPTAGAPETRVRVAHRRGGSVVSRRRSRRAGVRSTRASGGNRVRKKLRPRACEPPAFCKTRSGRSRRTGQFAAGVRRSTRRLRERSIDDDSAPRRGADDEEGTERAYTGIYYGKVYGAFVLANARAATLTARLVAESQMHNSAAAHRMTRRGKWSDATTSSVAPGRLSTPEPPRAAAAGAAVSGARATLPAGARSGRGAVRRRRCRAALDPCARAAHQESAAEPRARGARSGIARGRVPAPRSACARTYSRSSRA